MNSTEFCVIITTTDNLKNANDITSYLIENKLAACVQLEEVLSSFYWEEKLCQSKEFRLMIKALSASYSDVEKASTGLGPEPPGRFGPLARPTAWPPPAAR